VRPDLTPSGQRKEILMAVDEQKMEEAAEAAPFNIVLEARP